MNYRLIMVLLLLLSVNKSNNAHYLQTLSLSSKLILSAGGLWIVYGYMDSFINKREIKEHYRKLHDTTEWRQGKYYWYHDLAYNRTVKPIMLTAAAMVLKKTFNF